MLDVKISRELPYFIDRKLVLSARIAFGAIHIKEHENLTDERTVEYIAGNPYMQYFLGLHEYTDTPLFDPSMMVHFRKRFPAAKIEEINKRMFTEEKPKTPEDEPPPNSGKLVLDATIAPADIRYPVSERFVVTQ